jgi:hypothetical protein
MRPRKVSYKIDNLYALHKKTKTNVSKMYYFSIKFFFCRNNLMSMLHVENDRRVKWLARVGGYPTT